MGLGSRTPSGPGSPSGLHEQAGHMTASVLCGTLHFLLPGGGHPHMRRREHHTHRRRCGGVAASGTCAASGNYFLAGLIGHEVGGEIGELAMLASTAERIGSRPTLSHASRSQAPLSGRCQVRSPRCGFPSGPIRPRGSASKQAPLPLPSPSAPTYRRAGPSIGGDD
jgi:hypothetical protein